MLVFFQLASAATPEGDEYGPPGGSVTAAERTRYDDPRSAPSTRSTTTTPPPIASQRQGTAASNTTQCGIGVVADQP